MRMPRKLGGHLFRCNLRDSISREVCFTGHYEPQETALVRSILRPGMNFVDVGANWGYFTLLAASLVGEKGRILSLEPDPRLFPILDENVTRSGLDQVTALQIAAGSEGGFLSLSGYDDKGDNFGVSRVVSNPNDHEHIYQVNSDSLDNLLTRRRLDSVDLMKMDVEGAEFFAITGLERSLAAGRIKRLLLELHPAQLAEHGIAAIALMQRLWQMGYSAWTIDHSFVATRRAAYNRFVDIRELLHPLAPSENLDAWPHHLWLAPGIELCPLIIG